MTTAIAKPSHPLLPTVWIAVALTRGFGGQQLVQAARSLDDRIAAAGVDHRAVADDVVHDDQAAQTRQLEDDRETGAHAGRLLRHGAAGSTSDLEVLRKSVS